MKVRVTKYRNNKQVESRDLTAISTSEALTAFADYHQVKDKDKPAQRVEVVELSEATGKPVESTRIATQDPKKL